LETIRHFVRVDFVAARNLPVGRPSDRRRRRSSRRNVEREEKVTIRRSWPEAPERKQTSPERKQT
jgi:hypothetical protein